MDHKVILSSKGYSIKKSDLTYEKKTFIKTSLTVTPLSHPDYPKPASFPIYEEGLNWIRVPRSWGIQNFGEPHIDNLIDHKVKDESMVFKGTLRPNQMKPHEIVLERLLKDKTGILSLPTGHGKTIVTLSILSHLKQRACILIHKSHLLQQWKKQISVFLPNCKVGIIQQTKKTFSTDVDIYLVMMQTLINIPTVPAIFGITVCDETHHLPSNTFSKTLYKVNAKYLLGLSATPFRKDGLTKVLNWHMGDMIYQEKPNRRDQKTTEVNFYRYYSDDLVLNPRQNIEMIEKICNHEGRNQYILDILSQVIKQDTECHRYILILTERRKHAILIWQKLKEYVTGTTRTCGLALGGMKKELFDREKDKNIVVATYQALSEGIDIEQLNTILFASPKGDVVQSMGRIFRKVHTNIHPMIIDIVDVDLESKARRRLSTYNTELNRNIKVSYITNEEFYSNKETTSHTIVETEYEDNCNLDDKLYDLYLKSDDDK